MTLMEFFGFTQRFFEELLTPTPQPQPQPQPQPTAPQGPSDPAQAITITEGVRDVRMEAERDHLELGGQVMLRTKAVLDAMGQDDYVGAKAALQTLRDDLDTERQQRDTLQQQYDADKLALESGALAALPTKSPPGLEATYSKITPARGLLPAAPQTLADYTQATQALATLDAAIKAFRSAEQQRLDAALNAARNTYLEQRRRLENGNLKKLPEKSPHAALNELHAMAMKRRAALPDQPQTLADIEAGRSLLDAVARSVERYLRKESDQLSYEQRSYANELGRNADYLPKTSHPKTAGLLQRVREVEAGVPRKFDSFAARDAAFAALAELTRAADAFRAAEKELTEPLRVEYNQAHDAMIGAGIQHIYGKAPPGLEKEHAEVVALKNAIPRDNNFWAKDYEVKIEATRKATAAMEVYNKAEAALLPPVKERLAAEHKAVFEGVLAQVPAEPLKQLKGAHKTVQTARAEYEQLKPEWLEDYLEALEQLRRLKEAAERYLALGPELLAQEQAKFQQARAALEQGDLATIPETTTTSDAELAKAHAGVARARKALNTDPKTFDEVEAATKTLENLGTWVAHYTKLANGAQNVERGVAAFGAGGTRLAEVPGYENFNAQQLKYFNDTLPVELKKRNKTAFSDAELLDYAKSLGNYIGKLAETPIEANFPGINEALAKSDTLKTAIVQLQVRGWKIQAGKPGGGSYCSRGRECIVLDPDDNKPEDVLAGLAHEAGHAQFKPPSTPKPSQVASGIEYVTKGLESGFIDEGQAQMVACKVQKEMAQAGVPFRVPGGAAAFIAIYDRYLTGELSEDDARKEMGKRFNALNASGSGSPYRVEYGRPLIDAWNDAQWKVENKLSYDVLDTIVVFG